VRRIEPGADRVRPLDPSRRQADSWRRDIRQFAFRQLLKISGVGPKVALSVLSGLSVEDLSAAVAAEDAARLTKIPGIGKKTAERLVLELRDKLPKAIPGARSDASAASARRSGN
jgi:Holliday junction DNA helicase RuvA